MDLLIQLYSESWISSDHFQTQVSRVSIELLSKRTVVIIFWYRGYWQNSWVFTEFNVCRRSSIFSCLGGQVLFVGVYRWVFVLVISTLTMYWMFFTYRVSRMTLAIELDQFYCTSIQQTLSMISQVSHL